MSGCAVSVVLLFILSLMIVVALGRRKLSVNDNVISHKIETTLGGNEKESLDRPAWTSEQSTHGWEAYKYKHCVRGGRFKLIERKELRK